jgi:hypothetical protein
MPISEDAQGSRYPFMAYGRKSRESRVHPRSISSSSASGCVSRHQKRAADDINEVDGTKSPIYNSLEPALLEVSGSAKSSAVRQSLWPVSYHVIQCIRRGRSRENSSGDRNARWIAMWPVAH